MSFGRDKSECKIMEPQLIIPMTDGDIVITKDSDKFLSSVIALNTLNPENQMLLPNALENGLVIGMDQECLENINKKEVLLIQNSNFKLQPFSSEPENSTSYTLLYINQEKNEILWEGLLSKEANKPDFEDKGGLQFNESIAESSKTWHREFEETDSIISSRDKVISTSRNCEIEEKIILAVREDNKNNNYINNISKDSFMIDNYSTLQGSFACEPNITNDLNPTESKILVIPNENFQYMNFNKMFEKGSSNTIIVKKNVPLDFRETSKSNINKKLVAKEELELNIPNNCLGSKIHCESLRKEKSANSTLKETIAINILDNNKNAAGSDTGFSLPEKSLPLKKKAKMKNTIISPFSQKNEISRYLKDNSICEDSNKKNSKIQLKKNLCILKKSLISDMNGSLNCKSRKSNKVMRLAFHKGSASDGLIKQSKVSCQKKNCVNQTNNINDGGTKSDMKNEKFFFSKKLENENGSDTKLNSTFPFNFDENKFDNIYDLIEGLRKCKMINSSLWQILDSGLKEMNMDILQEIRNKHGTQCLTDSSSYSPQLKAFALVLYFKQPAAFHYLAKIYNSGWPSLNIIKEWKRRINCIKRTNFIASQREILKT